MPRSLENLGRLHTAVQQVLKGGGVLVCGAPLAVFWWWVLKVGVQGVSKRQQRRGWPRQPLLALLA